MTLKLYDTLTRKKRIFKPLKGNEVRMYSCGPTTYSYVHLGNLRAYVFVDLLRRYLKYKGFKLKHVMNITDVDDKTILESQKSKKSLKEFTEVYNVAFLEDFHILNIEIPEIMPKATETIPRMVKMIEKLISKGFAYAVENGDVYFKISKFKKYGELARLDVDNLKKNADGRLDDADEYEKEDARDFALWKSYDNADGDVFWNTSLGKGRPGWHIECSVMSTENLGKSFDIHTGGVDLIFPHHTNEIAQSVCSLGSKFVNFWMHNEHLIVNGKKMSKSLGNFYTLRDLLKKGYDPIAIRYELLAAHYRSKMDFRENNLAKIPETLQKFYDFLDKLDSVDGEGVDVSKLINLASKNFEKALDDDLNISGGLAAVFTFMTSVNKVMNKMNKKDAKSVKKLMKSFDSVLGVMEHEKGELDSAIEELIFQREGARKNKDFALADKIRDDLKKKGIILEDSAQGVRWKRV